MEAGGLESNKGEERCLQGRVCMYVGSPLRARKVSRETRTQQSGGWPCEKELIKVTFVGDA